MRTIIILMKAMNMKILKQNKTINPAIERDFFFKISS